MPIEAYNLIQDSATPHKCTKALFRIQTTVYIHNFLSCMILWVRVHVVMRITLEVVTVTKNSSVLLASNY